MIDSKINPVHTPCKDCVFAVYDKQTQKDCSLNYIDIYKNKNTEILEVYDNEKEFYIINGKKCIGYRENKWFQQFNLENSDLQSKIDKYHETNKLDYLIIVDLKSFSLEELEDTIKQISLCEIQPRKVILIRYTDNELRFPYSSIENILKQYNISYTWRVQTILDQSLLYKDILHNIVSLNSKYRFILSVSNYNKDISNIVLSTNKIVHNDLGQFDVISNKDHSCIIFSNIVYRFETFHGNDLLGQTDKYTIV